MAVIGALQSVLGRNSWPPPRVRETWEQIELYAAFRDSDATRLRQEDWVPIRQRYIISPVPRMISRTSAHMLFGEPPELKAAEEGDQANLDHIVEENDLAAELHRGAVIASSEGATWGRIVVDPSLLDVPIIEFASPSRVIPHFSGRFVRGATFVTEWATGHVERYRLLETYEAGVVMTQLFKGSTTSLGGEVDLDTFGPTEGRQPLVNTGIEWPLVAFIPNTIDADPTCGYSDYQGLRDRFLALNEGATIGQGNLRLAGEKRALVDAGYVNDRGRLPKGDDIFIRTSREGGDSSKSAPLEVIDYAYDAGQVVSWLDHLLDTTLSFAGIAPETVGRNVSGGALSGTALKLKSMHSLLEASGKGRFFDRGLGRLLRGAQIIDGRPTTQGGFGRSYVERDSTPAVERSPALPRDDVEAAGQLVQLVNAEAISLEERVAYLHPDWSQERIDDEVKAIRDDQPTSTTGLQVERPPIQLPSPTPA